MLYNKSMEIEFFRRGKRCPVKGFLDSLPVKKRAKALRNLELLKEFGLAAGARFVEPIGDGLFSLRTVFAGDQIRILFFTVIRNKAVLLSGFEKKTRKIPRREIALALKRKNDYIREHTRR